MGDKMQVQNASPNVFRWWMNVCNKALECSSRIRGPGSGYCIQIKLPSGLLEDPVVIQKIPAHLENTPSSASQLTVK